MPQARRNTKITTKQEVFFDFEREGKGSVRYSESADNGDEMIGKLYVKRGLWNKLDKPTALKVTIEPDQS